MTETNTYNFKIVTYILIRDFWVGCLRRGNIQNCILHLIKQLMVVFVRKSIKV